MNRSLIRVLKRLITFYEMLYKKKLLINYLRIFDCLVYIKIVKKGKKMILRNRK